MNDEGTTVLLTVNGRWRPYNTSHCAWIMGPLQYLLLYIVEQRYHCRLYCRRWQQYRIQYFSSKMKRKIKDAYEASKDPRSYNEDFWSAQANNRQTKTTSGRRSSRRFFGHQEKAFWTKFNDLVEPATAGLNTPKFTDFWYCTQFYNFGGQGLVDASGQVDAHTIWSPRPQAERWDDVYYDDLHRNAVRNLV